MIHLADVWYQRARGRQTHQSTVVRPSESSDVATETVNRGLVCLGVRLAREWRSREPRKKSLFQAASEKLYKATGSCKLYSACFIDKPLRYLCQYSTS